jgi:hypothetical protein
MSGFSADWLSLRESADHSARNVQVRDATAAAFIDLEHLHIVDLACGAGSNLRALAPFLSPRQSWRLVDHDELLLVAARDALLSWSDAILCRNPLVVRKGDREIEIEFLRADLAATARAALDGAVDLVTSAAFFDLVSSAWIESFCDELSCRGLPLNAVLTYSGEEIWRPPHAADPIMLEAFHRHQSGDKGFGPAAGPHGATLIHRGLEARGYRVIAGPSTWRLGSDDAALVKALAEGAAEAVLDVGGLSASVIAEWRTSRCAAEGCDIGHIDLFATRSG